MNTHTAIKLNLPWHTGHIGEDEFRREVVFEPNHNQVLTMITPDDPETAAFICRACNSHEALIESLKHCVNALEYWFNRYGDTEGLNSPMLTHARAALNLAEGRE